MRRTVSSLLLCTFLTPFTGCTSTETVEAQKEEKRLELAREVREELEIGREMAAKLLGYFGSEPSTSARSEYVTLVGQNLAKQFGRPEINYRFAVLKSKMVNAYAVPGGYIFVTKGLIDRLENESELAAVLAHEIAHVNQRHMYHQIRPKRDMTTNESVVRMMSRGASDLGNGLSQVVQAGMKALLEDGLGKDKELEADSMAVVIVQSAGYDGAAYTRFLARCLKNEAALKVTGMSVGFAERLETTNQSLAVNVPKSKSSADSKILDARFRRALRGEKEGA